MVSVEFVFDDDSVSLFVSVSLLRAFSSLEIKVPEAVGVSRFGILSGVDGYLSALDVGGGDGVGRRFEEEQLGEAEVL